MKKLQYLLAGLVLMVVLTSCDGKDEGGEKIGGELTGSVNAECHADGSCDEGLSCVGGICLEPQGNVVPGCIPNCADMDCGSDGCGGSCGKCDENLSCQKGKCISGSPDGVTGCATSCENRSCGDDGCGGSCGSCESLQTCMNGECLALCVPDCKSKTCGNNGCGGSCGPCDAPNEQCIDGQCIHADPPPPCTPKCDNILCGDDSCGGSCGNCETGQTCTTTGQCVPSCIPNCAGIECGSDGCGEICGTCTTTQTCEKGNCIDGKPPCTGSCDGKTCGDNGCGESCGKCQVGAVCVSGQCNSICEPECADKNCGSDGCDGNCGVCNDDVECVNGKCNVACTPSCEAKSCGSDGCGGSCGTCEKGKECQNGICVIVQQDCVSACGDKECGPDTCVEACGGCASNETCVNGSCVCQKQCEGKECGPDGCNGSCGACNHKFICSDSGTCESAPAAAECDDSTCGSRNSACYKGQACLEKLSGVITVDVKGQQPIIGVTDVRFDLKVSWSAVKESHVTYGVAIDGMVTAKEGGFETVSTNSGSFTVSIPGNVPKKKVRISVWPIYAQNKTDISWSKHYLGLTKNIALSNPGHCMLKTRDTDECPFAFVCTQNKCIIPTVTPPDFSIGGKVSYGELPAIKCGRDICQANEACYNNKTCLKKMTGPVTANLGRLPFETGVNDIKFEVDVSWPIIEGRGMKYGVAIDGMITNRKGGYEIATSDSGTFKVSMPGNAPKKTISVAVWPIYQEFKSIDVEWLKKYLSADTELVLHNPGHCMLRDSGSNICPEAFVCKANECVSKSGVLVPVPEPDHPDFGRQPWPQIPKDKMPPPELIESDDIPKGPPPPPR